MSGSEEIKEMNQSGKLIATYICSHTTDTSGTKSDRIDVDVCVVSFYLYMMCLLIDESIY